MMLVEAGTSGLVCLLLGVKVPWRWNLGHIPRPSWRGRLPKGGTDGMPHSRLADKGSSEKGSSYQFWGSRWVPTFASNAETPEANNPPFCYRAALPRQTP